MKKILDVIKENEVVHCKTLQEALDYCKIAHAQGLRWCDGCSYEKYNSWYISENDTVYRPHTGTYGTKSCLDNIYNVITYAEFKDRLNNDIEELSIPKGYVFDCVINGKVRFKKAVNKPKYVPYDFSYASILIGMKIKDRVTEQCLLITLVLDNTCLVGNRYITYKELLQSYTTLNNEPLGILE